MTRPTTRTSLIALQGGRLSSESTPSTSLSPQRRDAMNAALQQAAPRLFALLGEQIRAGLPRSELCASLEDDGGDSLQLGIQAVTDITHNFPVAGVERMESLARAKIAEGILPVVYAWPGGVVLAWLQPHIVGQGGDA